jgi:hypothetical protein
VGFSFRPYDGLLLCAINFIGPRILSFVTGLVNQKLLLRNEYLAAENRILRAHLPARLRLSDAERSTLAEIAKRLGRKALREIARVAKPDTLLAGTGNWWHTSSMVLVVAAILADPRYRQKWRGWCCGWRGRTGAGDMTASWVPWAI